MTVNLLFVGRTRRMTQDTAMRYARVAGSSLVRGAKKKDRFRTIFFLFNPKDWYVITRRVNGIAAAYGITYQRVSSFGLITYITS